MAVSYAFSQGISLPNNLSTKKKTNKENSYFLPIYQFKENEKVASIGASFGLREIMFSMESPKIFFYLQDIDPRFLKPEYVQGFIFSFQRIYGEKTKSEFRLAIGDSVSTNLPAVIFDKILIENSLHEFTHVNEMLADILPRLAKDGYLFISEKIATKPNQKHKGCKKILFFEQQLIKLLNKFDYEIVEKKQPYPKQEDFFVFKFKKKTPRL